MRNTIRRADPTQNLFLRRGELLRFNQPAGATSLRIDRGRVWVTRENENQDFILCCAKSVEVAGHGLVVVEALEDAELVVG